VKNFHKRFRNQAGLPQNQWTFRGFVVPLGCVHLRPDERISEDETSSDTPTCINEVGGTNPEHKSRAQIQISPSTNPVMHKSTQKIARHAHSLCY
jgi:hypothetical protein